MKPSLRMTRATFDDRFLAAVLFVDIVGSTNHLTELGDQRWSSLLREHGTLVKTQIARWDGQEVDSAGDGCFATFDIPAKAIGCAWTIGHHAHKLGIQIRAGVHVGECERQDQKVRGLAVHVGARVASKADPGEILISKTTRDLIQGSGIRLKDRGSHTLKGAPGRWRLFGVEGMGAENQSDQEDRAGVIGVMLVDDHPLWRETIRRVLENDDSLAIVGEASDGQEAIDVARQRRPEVILMDLHLPTLSGTEATPRILEVVPESKVLVLSSSDEQADVAEALAAGASGYLLKTADAYEIAAAVLRVNQGELVFPPSVSRIVLNAIRNRGRTRRKSG